MWRLTVLARYITDRTCIHNYQSAYEANQITAAQNSMFVSYHQHLHHHHHHQV